MPPTTEMVLARHEPCAWLPEGGLAEVVLSNAAAAPQPTSVARLLVTAGTAMLVVERADRHGLDIPSAKVTSDVESTLLGLRSTVLTDTEPPYLLGFVRNTVTDAASDYPWPMPIAHFAVWHCIARKDAVTPGHWIELHDAEALLGERHWWPLAKFMAIETPMTLRSPGTATDR